MLDAQKREEDNDIIMEDVAMAESSSDWEEIPNYHIHQIPMLPLGKQRSLSLLDHQHAQPAQKHNLKEDTINQYVAWTKLIPSLVKPLLNFLSKTLGTPSPTSVKMPRCSMCDGQKTAPMLCLFWDHKLFN